MTELPHAHDDEIVSAVLDGEATAEELARMEREPALRARLAELQAVRDAVAEPVEPLDELTSRRLIDRALGAADEPAAAPSTAAARRRSWDDAVRYGAAAAVALVALAGGIALVGTSGDDADMATAPAEDSAEVTAFGGGADGADGEIYGFSSDDEAGEMAGDVAGDAAADPDADGGSLPPFADTDALVDAARQRTTAEATRADAPTTPLSGLDTGVDPSRVLEDWGCAQELEAEMAEVVSRPVVVESGMVDGRPMAAFVGVDGEPLVVVDLEACRVVPTD